MKNLKNIGRGRYALMGCIIALTLTMNLSYAQGEEKPEVIPMQIYDLRKMTDEEQLKWIVYSGQLDKPVIVEVSGANTEEFWITVGKTMRGLQHGGLSNLVLVQTNDAKHKEASDEVILLYEKGKPVTMFENPLLDTRLKAQIQETVMKLYDRVHGTNFYPDVN